MLINMSEFDQPQANEILVDGSTPKQFAATFLKKVQGRGDIRPVEVDAQNYEIRAKDRPPFNFRDIYIEFNQAEELDRPRILHAALNRWQDEMGPDPGAQHRDAVAAEMRDFMAKQAIEKNLSEDHGSPRPIAETQWDISKRGG
jgi:hypothetical protein